MPKGLIGGDAKMFCLVGREFVSAMGSGNFLLLSTTCEIEFVSVLLSHVLFKKSMKLPVRILFPL